MTHIAAITMIARSAPSPSSPAPLARRCAALGAAEQTRRPCRQCAALTLLHDYLTTSDRSNAGFLKFSTQGRYIMALGDGIRRNIATVSPAERNRFRDAIIALHQRFFPGDRTDFPAGHVSYWFKQDEIHQATHVHGGPAFLPWHRELCNRFEAMLRTIHPRLSLHYWDWTLDPSNMPDGQ